MSSLTKHAASLGGIVALLASLGAVSLAAAAPGPAPGAVGSPPPIVRTPDLTPYQTGIDAAVAAWHVGLDAALGGWQAEADALSAAFPGPVVATGQRPPVVGPQ
jgi:hypothetical protein